MPDHQDALTFYRKYMPPEALAPGIPLAVREAIRQYCREESERRRPGNLRPQLLAVWTTIRGELALFSNEDVCELPHTRLADLSGVGVNQVGGYVDILVELGLLSIVGEREGVGACRPSPVYDINHLELLRRSEEMFLDACTWRGIKRLPKSKTHADQLSLFDESITSERSPSPGSDGETVPSPGSGGVHPPEVMVAPPPGDGGNPPSLPSDSSHHPENNAAESDNQAELSLPGEPSHHPEVIEPSLGSDGQPAHAWTHESTDRSDVVDEGTTAEKIGDLTAALRAILPELLNEIGTGAQKNGAAAREFEPPISIDIIPEPRPGRAALPAHPWRLWVAACPEGATERDWNSLAWLASQHGWHWVGEAIMQLANGADIDSTKRIKVKLDWWRRNNNYGSNNRKYEQMLASEEAPVLIDVPPVAGAAEITEVAEAEEEEALTETEQYLLDQGFSAKAAREFSAFELEAVKEHCRRELSAYDSTGERDKKIGGLVQRWRKQPPSQTQKGTANGTGATGGGMEKTHSTGGNMAGSIEPPPADECDNWTDEQWRAYTREQRAKENERYQRLFGKNRDRV